MADDKKALALAVDAATAPLEAQQKIMRKDLAILKDKAPIQPAPASVIIGPASAYATGYADERRGDASNPLMVTTATGFVAAGASVVAAVAGAPSLAQAAADVGNANLSVLTHEAGRKKGAAARLKMMAARAGEPAKGEKGDGGAK